MESSSGGREMGNDPVLPIFIQMNARLAEEDDHWKEVTRWVKFQENVEDGGKRWSKPHVPSCAFSVISSLREHVEQSPCILDSEATDIHSIVDEILAREQFSDFDESVKQNIKDLFLQGVKQKMKISLARQMSKSSVFSSSSGLGRQESLAEEVVPASDNKERMNQSAPSSPVKTRRRPVWERPAEGGKEQEKEGGGQEGEEEQEEEEEVVPKRRHFTVTFTSDTGPSSRKISLKDETLKLREFNLFNKKVPKNAEAANIQVATCSFLSEYVFAFVRLKNPVMLEDFCEVNKPTRFLALILGPEGSGTIVQDLGKALGTLLTDQLFCSLSAYRGTNKKALLKGIDTYIEELTVLPPSAWDPNIRLDPPKSTQTIQSRLINRLNIRQRHPTEEDDEDLDDIKTRLKTDVKKDHLEDDGLQFTGRLFGGLIDDIKRKAPSFLSDFTDALNVQTLASIIYIYLATITKAITFGGFLGDITQGLQGVLESFLGHALAGGVFCLLAGQPLTVLGCTGPVLIFEKILVDFCSSNGLNYLTMRLWIGLWSSLFCIVIVAVDGSAIVRYFTRFTEEAFAALVGIIFIVESLKKLFKMSKLYKVHSGLDPDMITEETCQCLPWAENQMTVSSEEAIRYLYNHNIRMQEEVGGNVTFNTEDVNWAHLSLSNCKMLGGELEGNSCHYVPDIFFFSVILFFGTFFFCSSLKKFKFSPFFPTRVRSLVADYAVIITIIIFVLIDSHFALATPKLIVPTIFKPTRSDVRGWLIPLFDENSPGYMYLLACIPALLLTILLFMDQQITSVIVNRKEHKLRKGGGYHLDMFIVGLMMGVCSILGLPWCVAATVLCLGHVDSLKMDTESSAPGETPQFLGVREQRVTGVMVFILTGLSVKLAPVLKFIPMPVLYGVLLYMGVNTLTGMQFIDRMSLMLMPSKHQPDYKYLRHVPLKKVHLFTLIQAAALAGLWFIKSTPASLIFPLMVLALVGFRKVMDYFPGVFSQNDLFWLDNLMPHSDKEKKKKKKSKKESKKEKEKAAKKKKGEEGLLADGGMKTGGEGSSHVDVESGNAKERTSLLRQNGETKKP